MKEWGRLITAMVTPFDEHLQVNIQEAIKLGKQLVDDGATALVLTGTTGEAPTLTRKEKMNLYRSLKTHIDVPILAGVGSNATSTTIAQAKQAERAGVDGLLIVTPYYNKPSQQALYTHFTRIAESVALPIMLYNVPGRTSCNMLPTTVSKLSKIRNITALKEASGDIVQLTEMIKQTEDDFLVYTGDDVMTLPSLAVGAYGVVSVSAHLVAKEMQAMIQAYLAGDIKQAKNLHHHLFDLFQTLFIETNPVPVKTALQLLGRNVGDVRLPLQEGDEVLVNTIKVALQRLKAL